MEDNLFGAFKHLNLGSKDVDGILKTMVRNSQIGILKQLRKQIDNQIEQLSGIKVGLDPFEILGIKPDATRPEVEKAYRSKAWKAHPDHGGTDNEMMKVNAAYEAIRTVRGWK